MNQSTLIGIEEEVLSHVAGGVEFPPVDYDEFGAPVDDDIPGSGFPEWYW